MTTLSSIHRNYRLPRRGAETNIDQSSSRRPAPASAHATFEPAQFGAGLISNTVHITGDDCAISSSSMFSSAGSFSAAGWTFEDWSPG